MGDRPALTADCTSAQEAPGTRREPGRCRCTGRSAADVAGKRDRKRPVSPRAGGVFCCCVDPMIDYQLIDQKTGDRTTIKMRWKMMNETEMASALRKIAGGLADLAKALEGGGDEDSRKAAALARFDVVPEHGLSRRRRRLRSGRTGCRRAWPGSCPGTA